MKIAEEAKLAKDYAYCRFSRCSKPSEKTVFLSAYYPEVRFCAKHASVARAERRSLELGIVPLVPLPRQHGPHAEFAFVGPCRALGDFRVWHIMKDAIEHMLDMHYAHGGYRLTSAKRIVNFSFSETWEDYSPAGERLLFWELMPWTGSDLKNTHCQGLYYYYETAHNECEEEADYVSLDGYRLCLDCYENLDKCDNTAKALAEIANPIYEKYYTDRLQRALIATCENIGLFGDRSSNSDSGED